MIVPSLEDAVIAVLFNHNIQCCVVRSQPRVESMATMSQLRHHYVGVISPEELETADGDSTRVLSQVLKRVRPEVDLYRVVDSTVGCVSVTSTRAFRRVFYRYEDR